MRALDDGGPALAATAAVLPYGDRVAWISMVLVRPDRRREGLATALMRWAVEHLRAAGSRSIALDAAPAGRPVYAGLGFRALWDFSRRALPATLPAEPGVTVRPLREADRPELLARDQAGFAAPREPLLRGFAARAPGFVVPGRGVMLGRDGLRGPQLGPLYADDEVIARALLAAGSAAVPGVVLDLRDAAGLGDWLARHGGRAQRPFTRMALGEDPPGDPARTVAVAGPEFG